MLTKISPAAVFKYLCVILLIIFAGCSAPSPKTGNQPDKPLFTEVASKDLYVHRPTGMEFPMKVAGFNRTKILEYDERGSNVSVGYELKNFGMETAQTTVYIYPAENSLEKEYDRSRGFLFSVYGDAYDLEEGQTTIGQPFGVRTGQMCKFKYNPPEMFGGKLCYGRLYLFRHGPWFIKYRLTNRDKDDEKVVEQFGVFMQTLFWPELPETQVNELVAPPVEQ